MSATLSVVIPAYNEERFIGTLLERLRAVDLSEFDTTCELIVVDDCSKDRTAAIVAEFPDVVLHRMPRNGGKGAAVRAGLGLARGEYIIIQDADLEYDPQDYVPMMRALIETGADAVYGNRYAGDHRRGALHRFLSARHPNQSWAAYLGGRSLSLAALAFTRRWIADTVTALKLFRRDVIVGLDLRTSGFELDHEITSRVLARGVRIIEVPIRYDPRSREEGKKIGARDWFRGVATFYRFRNG